MKAIMYENYAPFINLFCSECDIVQISIFNLFRCIGHFSSCRCISHLVVSVTYFFLVIYDIAALVVLSLL
jgi:hypothetical protein